jgi:hypothetical protein
VVHGASIVKLGGPLVEQRIRDAVESPIGQREGGDVLDALEAVNNKDQELNWQGAEGMRRHRVLRRGSALVRCNCLKPLRCAWCRRAGRKGLKRRSHCNGTFFKFRW